MRATTPQSRQRVPTASVYTPRNPRLDVTGPITPNSEPRRKTDSSVGVVEENNNVSRGPQFLTPQPVRSTGAPKAGRLRPKSTGSPRGTEFSPRGLKKDFAPSASSDSIVVALRIRPLLPREIPDVENKPAVFADVGDKRVFVNASGNSERKELSYDFEKVFDDSGWNPDDGTWNRQERVFHFLAKPQLDSMLNGYNCTILAYGQTGSGKTFSMFGTEEEPGIIHQFSRALFGAVGMKLEDSSARLEMSYFEIYNEQVHDLLDVPSKKVSSLRVREHPDTGPFVEGLTFRAVMNETELKRWLEVGMHRRATATTGMNDHSSRSHAIVQLRLTQIQTLRVEEKDRQFPLTSLANLVDLAGSERSATAQEGTAGISQKKERYRETVAINTSLHVLKRVITILSCSGKEKRSTRKSGIFVPYRDSPLTWLLKESLGGNSKTSLLITVSPLWTQRDETVSSLRFGSEASSVVTRARVNEDHTSAILKRIKELEEENARLIEELSKDTDGRLRDGTETKLRSLRELLAEQEEQMNLMQQSFERRQKESEAAREAIDESALFPVSSMPKDRDGLIETCSDPMMPSSVVVLRESGTTIGSGDICDVWRDGLISPVHCTLEKQRYWILTPAKGADVFLNGDRVTDKTILAHLDRLCLGGERFFLCWIPSDWSRSRTSQGIKLELARHNYSAMRLELFEKQWPELEKKLNDEAESNRAQLEKDLSEKLEEQKRQRREVEAQLETTERRKRELEQHLHSLSQENRENSDRLEHELSELKKRHETLLSRRVKEEIDENVHTEFQSSLMMELKKKEAELHRNYQEQARHMDSPQRESVAALMFQVERANEILKHLKTSYMKFEHFDSEGMPEVRLTNTKQGISTVIEREEFLCRVEVLKTLFVNGGEDKDAVLQNILFNPSDEWEKTAGRASDLYSAALVNALKATAKKRGSTVRDVRKSLMMPSPKTKTRRSTLTSILESSLAEEEEDLTESVGSVAFWGPVSGIMRDMSEEYVKMSERSKRPHPVTLILKECTDALTLSRDLDSFSSGGDHRLHHAMQTTVTKMILHIQIIVAHLLTLAPSSDFRQANAIGGQQLSKTAALTCETWLSRELKECGTLIMGSFNGWIQGMWKGLDAMNEESLKDLRRHLENFCFHLGYYVFHANELCDMPSNQKRNSKEVRMQFLQGSVKGFSDATQFLIEESESASTDTWISAFLKEVCSEQSDILGWANWVMKNDSMSERFLDVIGDVIQPCTHGLLFLTDSAASSRRRIDVMADTLYQIRAEIDKNFAELNLLEPIANFLPDGRQEGEQSPHTWLAEKLDIFTRKLNSVTSDLSTADTGSFLATPIVYMKRLIASPRSSRRTSVWAKDQLSMVDTTGYSDDCVDV